MAKSTYLLIITFNTDGLNALIKTEWLNGYKNKTHLYAAYRTLTPELMKHTD